MSNVFEKSWEPAVTVSVMVTVSLSMSVQMSNAYVDPWEMLNNYCFHVYAQK